MKRLLLALLFIPCVASAQSWQQQLIQGLANGAANETVRQMSGAAAADAFAQQQAIQQQQDFERRQQAVHEISQWQLQQQRLSHDAYQQEQNRRVFQQTLGGMRPQLNTGGYTPPTIGGLTPR